jgi:hypothetical protein
MFDPQLIGAPGIPGLRRVWRVDVTGHDLPTPTPASPNAQSGPKAAPKATTPNAKAGPTPTSPDTKAAPKRTPTEDLHKLVLVDAGLGTVVLAVDQDQRAEDRRVCDYANTIPTDDLAPCASDQVNVARTEGGPPSSVEDVNNAYEFTGATYDFYENNFGRDSIDNLGMTIASSVRVCLTGLSCPYQNAFWDGDKMVFGSGFAGADDIVGHELTHGVVQYTSNLFYGYQSGAINESLADTMGEFIDQQYLGTSTDGSGEDWLIGEDLPPSIGVLRNMADPTVFGDPDRMTSDFYRGESHFADPVTPDDSGWVHANSGVGNKAAYLMAAPGTRTFNGVEVTGLGIAKAAQVYYRAMLLLTSGSDYADLAIALDTACTQLAAGNTPPAGLVPGDCVQVRAATAAVDMGKQPAAAEARAPEAIVCPNGTTVAASESDDFEGSRPHWTLTGDQADGFGYYDGYAHSGVWSLVGSTGDTGSLSRQSATWSTGFTVPRDRSTYLWFAHVFMLEQYDGSYYDGGRIEYRLDGTGAWIDAAPLITSNGYNVNLQPDAGAGTGRFFGGDSHGYESTRADLTPLRGHSVELRFAVYGDAEVGSSWLIDDVDVYQCAGSANGSLRELAITGTGPSQAAITWLPPEVTGPSPISKYRVEAIGETVSGLPIEVASTGTFRVLASGLKGGTSFHVTPYVGSTPGSVETIAVKASTVTLAASAASITYARPLTLTGHVTVAGGGTPGGTVTILGRRKGTATWSTVTTATVPASGNYSIAVKPATNIEYVAHTSGSENVLGATSPIRTVFVAPQVGIHASATTIRRGQAVKLTGATAPVRKSVAVYIHILKAGKWQFYASGRTSASGNYAFSIRPPSTGKFTYRTVVAADATYAQGTSIGMAITVR